MKYFALVSDNFKFGYVLWTNIHKDAVYPESIYESSQITIFEGDFYNQYVGKHPYVQNDMYEREGSKWKYCEVEIYKQYLYRYTPEETEYDKFAEELLYPVDKPIKIIS